MMAEASFATSQVPGPFAENAPSKLKHLTAA
jgi:hypothetical protein